MQNVKATIDIGNAYLKGVVFAEDEGKTVILAKEMVRSKGLRKGKILDTDDFITSLNELIELFMKKLGGDFLDEVFISISHPEMVIEKIKEHKRILTDTITNDDVNHLSKVTHDIAQKPNFEIIKIVPTYWVIDDQRKEKDPVGLQGRNLELVADVFSVPKNFITTLVDIFDKLDIHVSDIIPNMLGSAEAAFDFDLKDLGTLLIDIGHNQTSFVVYEDGYPLYHSTLALGGEDVTKDISIGLQVDIKEAENIKKDHGKILIEDYGPGELPSDSPLDISFLSNVMTARYEEIFEKINQHLIYIGKESRLPGGVVLIGGGAKAENLDQLAKQVFKLACFYGKERNLHIGELSTNLQFINVFGTYLRSNKYSDARKGGFGLKFNFNAVGRVWKFVKEIF